MLVPLQGHILPPEGRPPPKVPDFWSRDDLYLTTMLVQMASHPEGTFSSKFVFPTSSDVKVVRWPYLESREIEFRVSWLLQEVPELARNKVLRTCQRCSVVDILCISSEGSKRGATAEKLLIYS